jgi:hypothetical protein
MTPNKLKELVSKRKATGPENKGAISKQLYM